MSQSSPIQQKRLYEIVAERILKEHVLAMTAGDRLPTENEFSKAFHVSVPTVREALRSLVQSGYLHRRQGSGTYRAEKIQDSEAPQEKAVAIITALDLADGSLSVFYPQIALRIYKLLSRVGIPAKIFFGETAPEKPRAFDDSSLLSDMHAGKISAAILIAESPSEAHYVEELQARGIPVLSADNVVNAGGVPRSEDFIKTAVAQLTGLGRRKIAFIGQAGLLSHKIREIVEDFGAITDEAWMIGDLHPNQAGSGYSLMREVWTTGKVKPDGVIVCDDVFFADVALAVEELSISVPDQLIVATAKNSGVRLVSSMPFITIQFDAADVADQIVENVVSSLAGRSCREVVVEHSVTNPFHENGFIMEAHQGKTPQSC